VSYKKWVLPLAKDIRFWIVLSFILHMSAISLPPLEPGSTWRQSDGLMIARNFYEHNPTIFYPTVDLAGEKSGIVGCEFPILNYLIYLISLIFGYASWYGRLINVIVSSVGVFYYYRLIRNYFGDASAFNATIIVLVSVWFTYERTTIPDTFAASLCLVSLYYAIYYLEEGKIYQLFFYFILGLFGCLSKISAATILSVLAIPVFLGSGLRKRKISFCFFSALILISLYGWYFGWVPYLNTNYGFGEHFFMGMPFRDSVNQLLENWPKTLERFYDTPFKVSGFIAFLTGLYFAIKKKLWLQLALFIVPFTAFCVVILKTGSNFHIDAYYVIMFIPSMAFIAGCGLAQINHKLVVTILLLVVGIEGIANQLHVFQIRQPNKSLETLEPILDRVSDRDDLIAINGDHGDPTPMYQAHRRGWVEPNEFFLRPGQLDRLRMKGCRYIVILKKFSGDLDLALEKVYDSEQFKVYKIAARES